MKLHSWNASTLFFVFIYKRGTEKKVEKCDMFLIALDGKDNDHRGNTWNISHVIHAVVGEWKRASEREGKKYLLKWFMLLFRLLP